MVGPACDDPPANQGIPPRSTQSGKVKSTQSSPSATAGSDTVKAGNNDQTKPTSTDASHLLEKARSEIRSSAPKKAMSTLRVLLQHHPKHEEGYLTLADLLETDGKTQEALRLLEDGIDQVARPNRLLSAAAEGQARSGLIAKSNGTIERLVSISPAPDKARLRHALLLAELGAWTESFKQFEQLQEGTTLTTNQKVVFARVLEALKMVGRALKLLGCDVANPTPPRKAEEELRCGALFTASEDYKQAAKHLKQAQTMDASERSFFYLGQNEFAQGAFDEAARHFRRASELDTKALDSKLGYAKALRAMGSRHNLGKALRTLNDVVNAYGRFKTKLELKTRDPQVFLERAEIFLQIKEDKRALADLESGLALAPGDTRLLVAKAKALYYSRRTAKAMALLKELLKERPNEPEANFFLARMHLASGESSAAIKHFELSIKHGKGTFGDVFEAHSSLINLYKERNKLRKACEHMKRYLKSAPRTVTDREDVTEDLRRNCR